jgi:acetyl esterase/lipase
MKKLILFALCFGLLTGNSLGQNELLPLWPNNIPNYQKTDEKETRNQREILWIEKVQEPTLAVYLPAKRNATGKAVVVCPGGGYQGLAYDWEGIDIAKWLNYRGIAAFVLKYRLPSQS